MSAGFVALSDDGIDATSFQPARLLDRCRRRHNTATRRPDPGQQLRDWQAKMEAHHLGHGVLDHRAHGLVERYDIHARRRWLAVDPKFTAIRRKPFMPSVLAARIRLRRGVTEEVDVERIAGVSPQLLNYRRSKLWLHRRATDRA
jgi:hypothetical protein